MSDKVENVDSKVNNDSLHSKKWVVPTIERDTEITSIPCKVERTKMNAFAETPDSLYVVDDSCFIPISEAIKQLQGNSVSAGEIEQTYDFPNGRDNGSDIPYTRRFDTKDIAEISSQIMQDANELSEKISKEKARIKKEKEFNNLVSPKSTPTPKTE